MNEFGERTLAACWRRDSPVANFNAGGRDTRVRISGGREKVHFGRMPKPTRCKRALPVSLATPNLL